MSAEQSLREGDLERAKVELQEQVRQDPANSKPRIFLFQLLAVLGEWDRAMIQLNVLGEIDASTLPMVQVYREALRCEVLRAEIFAGRKSPLVLGEPEPWLATLQEALRNVAEGRPDRAKALRERAFEEAPSVPGTIDGASFEWLADADTRLGPVLEGIVNGRYYWVPFQRIRDLRIEKPGDLRDFVWAPAQFSWVNGGETVGLIPARYVGSESSEENATRLARRTEWLDRGADCVCGLGQRMLATDRGEYSLLDVRHVHLDVPAASASSAGVPAG